MYMYDVTNSERLALGAVRCSPNYLLEEKVSGVPPVFQGREEFQPCSILIGTEMENGIALGRQAGNSELSSRNEGIGRGPTRGRKRTQSTGRN